MTTRKSGVKFIFGALIVCIAILPFYFYGNQLRNWFFSFSSPAASWLSSFGNGVSGYCASVFNAGNLNKEKEDLKAQNNELISKLISYDEIKNENEALRRAIGVGISKDFKLEMANVISKDISGDFVMINKGTDDNLATNMVAITAEKAVAGRVVDVYKNFSRIMLITNKKSSLDAEVEGKDTAGVLRGNGRMSALLDLIPREKNISEGDIIKTSNITGDYPPGLLVGKITKVKKNDVEAVQQAEIEQSYDINRDKEIFIILQTK